METKSINYFQTSNMAIEINEMWCYSCDGTFYELEEHTLEECPLCNAQFEHEPSKNDWDADTYTLIVDHKTGIPSVIRNDEYEAVLKPKAIESNETA